MTRVFSKQGFGAGFTLVETVIIIGLFTAALFGALELYLVFGRVVADQESSIGIALDASALADAVRTAGAQADGVVASHAFSGVAYASGTTTVIFELPAVDSAGAIIPSAYDHVGFHASGTEAYRLIDAAPGSARVSGRKVIADTLAELRFTYDAASFPLVTRVTTDATTSAALGSEELLRHVRGLVYLRNL